MVDQKRSQDEDDEQYFWAFHSIVMTSLLQMAALWSIAFEKPLPEYMGDYDRLVVILNPGVLR